MPKISVIVPIYNVELYINRCIDSILNQTFTDFELILVDDSSPDNCGKICDEYTVKDNRIRVIHQQNGGLSAARNAGIDWAIANSYSEWLTFIDSDDWVLPVTLEKLYEANISNNTAVSRCSFERTTGEEPKININEIVSVVTEPEKYYVENNVNTTIACAKLYKKECFSTLRYPVGILHEDEFTTYKILFKYDTISVIDAPLYMYYQNESGIMRSEWGYKRLDALEAFELQITYFEKNNFQSAKHLAIKRYLFKLKAFLEQNKIKKSSFITKIYYKVKLKHNLKKVIKKYKKPISITTGEYEWIYAEAFPLRNLFLSYLKKLFNRVES